MILPRMRKTGLVLSAVALLAGCGGGGGGVVSTTTAALNLMVESIIGGNFSADALSQGFVSSFAGLEDEARRLRDSALYQRQNFSWYVDRNRSGAREPNEPLYRSYSLASARVDYAHAAGLRGAGQIIAVVDGDFRPGHEALAGRVLAYGAPSDRSQITQAEINHGTSVASVTAGLSGSMIGVAPGANLLLHSYSTPQDLTTATHMARTQGAVVQNNSWGYAGVAATRGNFDALFGAGRSNAAYLAALRLYAQNGVVVFAADNANGATQSSIMEALPQFAPELEPGWLAVVNAVPSFDNDRIINAERLSAPCLQAARWCLTADGAWMAASGTGDADYALVIGTSFAAPVVSGAIALLAEAFPNLTPHDLRARLIATADNRFDGFTPSGRLEVIPGSGVFHDFSTEWGHGFLDVRAALLPIGTPSARMADGSSHSVARPLILSGGATGDAVARSLAGVPVLVTDLLGGDFTMPGDALAAQAAPAPVVERLWPAMFGAGGRGALIREYGGADMSLRHGGIEMALMGPDRAGASPGGAAPAMAALIGQSVAAAGGDLFIGLNVARDDGRLMPGIGGAGSHLAALELAYTRAVGMGGFVELGGTFGMSPGGATGLADQSDIRFNAFRIEAGQADVLRSGDRLSLGLSLPVAVTSGRAEMALPVARGAGGISHRSVEIDFAPEARELDLSITYGTPFGPGGEVFVGAIHAFNHGHVAGREETAAVLGFRMAF